MLLRVVAMGLVGGSLLAISFVVPGAWIVNLAAVAAFAYAQQGSRGARTIGAFAFGWAAFVGGYHWLQPTLVALWGGRTSLSWAVWGALAAWFSFRFVLIAWGFFALERRGAGLKVALTVPWLLVEWLYPSLFPFHLGSPWVDGVQLAALSAVGGPLLLTALLCVIGSTVAELVSTLIERRSVDRRSLTVAVAAVGLAVVTSGVSDARAKRAIERASTLVVGVVQENVDVVSDVSARALTHRRYLDASEALERDAKELDLIVWPETVYAVPMVDRLPTSGAVVRGALRHPLLFGGVVESASGDRWNSALLVDADGQVGSSYHKQHLIPFAEFVPWAGLLSRWDVAAPTQSRFHQGPASPAIVLGNYRIATPICYEAVRPDYVRRLMQETDANIMVTLANDGWFGDSAAPRIHLMLARMRAIEHRRYLVRATNTGISAIIDPFGRVIEATPLRERASLVGTVHPLEERTLYGMFGNWPGAIALAYTLLWLWRQARVRYAAETSATASSW